MRRAPLALPAPCSRLAAGLWAGTGKKGRGHSPGGGPVPEPRPFAARAWRCACQAARPELLCRPRAVSPPRTETPSGLAAAALPALSLARRPLGATPCPGAGQGVGPPPGTQVDLQPGWKLPCRDSRSPRPPATSQVRPRTKAHRTPRSPSIRDGQRAASAVESSRV